MCSARDHGRANLPRRAPPVYKMEPASADRLPQVAIMKVADLPTSLREFSDAVEQPPEIFEAVSHLVPFGHMFDFKNPAEFEAKAREVPLLRAGALGQVVPCATGILLQPWASA